MRFAFSVRGAVLVSTPRRDPLLPVPIAGPVAAGDRQDRGRVRDGNLPTINMEVDRRAIGPAAERYLRSLRTTPCVRSRRGPQISGWGTHGGGGLATWTTLLAAGLGLDGDDRATLEHYADEWHRSSPKTQDVVVAFGGYPLHVVYMAIRAQAGIRPVQGLFGRPAGREFIHPSPEDFHAGAGFIHRVRGGFPPRCGGLCTLRVDSCGQ